MRGFNAFKLMNNISRKTKIGKTEFLDSVEWIDRFADMCAQDGIYDFEVEDFVSRTLCRELSEKERIALEKGIKMGIMTRAMVVDLGIYKK